MWEAHPQCQGACDSVSGQSGPQVLDNGSVPARRWILAAVAGVTHNIMHLICGQSDISRENVLYPVETWVFWFSSCSFSSSRNPSQFHSWKHLPTSWGSDTRRNWVCLVMRAVPVPLCSLLCSACSCHLFFVLLQNVYCFQCSRGNYTTKDSSVNCSFSPSCQWIVGRKLAEENE